jgi:hypothetical protein
MGLKPGFHVRLATNRLINSTVRHGCYFDYVDGHCSSNQQPSSYIADETAADLSWLYFCNGEPHARERKNDIVRDKQA